MDALRVAIVDPLSLAGKELRRLLPSSGLPIAEVLLLDRPEADGTLSEYDGEAAIVKAFSQESVEHAHLVFFCGHPDLLRESLPGLEARGATLMDLTGTLELEGERGVGISGVNATELPRVRTFRAPHPATVLLGTLFRALVSAAPVERASAVVLLPVAEHGQPGLEELYEQTRELLAFRPPPTAVLGTRVAFDVVPVWGEVRTALERRVAEELRFALGRSAPPTTVSTLRVPVFLGLAIDVVLELESEEDGSAVEDALRDAKDLRLTSFPFTPGSLPDDASDPIHVSVHAGDEPGRVRIWAAADALTRCLLRNALEVLTARLTAHDRA